MRPAPPRSPGSHARASDCAVECGAVETDPERLIFMCPASPGAIPCTPASGDIDGVKQVTVRPIPDVLGEVQHRRLIVVKLNIEHAAGEVILGTPVRSWCTVQPLLFDHESGTPEPLEDFFADLKAAGMALRQGNGRNYRLERT